MDFLLGTTCADGLVVTDEGQPRFSPILEKRIVQSEAEVIATPVYSGPINDESAHFAYAIHSMNTDVAYVYDSLEDSDLPAKVVDCIREATGSAKTTGVQIGADEKQRGAWECGYFVIRRQFLTLLLLLSAMDPSGVTHPFRVTDEWFRTVLSSFHDNVALKWSAGGMTDAIKSFVNVTLFQVRMFVAIFFCFVM